MNSKDKIKKLAQAHFGQFVKVRRHLHQHPELSFNEYHTCAYVREQLLAIGISEIESVAKTGLIATRWNMPPKIQELCMPVDMMYT